MQSAVFLANAYIDLGTWNCLTPFIGVGVGGAYNIFADLTDTGIGTSGAGVGRNSNQLSFAWALHAGLAYNVTQNFSVELAYRYLNYGSVTDTIDLHRRLQPRLLQVQNFSSNDFMLGMRWRFPVDCRVMSATRRWRSRSGCTSRRCRPRRFMPPPQYQPQISRRNTRYRPAADRTESLRSAKRRGATAPFPFAGRRLPPLDRRCRRRRAFLPAGD